MENWLNQYLLHRSNGLYSLSWVFRQIYENYNPIPDAYKEHINVEEEKEEEKGKNEYIKMEETTNIFDEERAILESLCIVRKSVAKKMMSPPPSRMLTFWKLKTLRKIGSRIFSSRHDRNNDDDDAAVYANYELRRRVMAVGPTFSESDLPVVGRSSFSRDDDYDLEVDCGPYKTVREIEHLLRLILRLERGGGKKRRIVYGLNYNVCNRALANVRKFYADPDAYDRSWSNFVTSVDEECERKRRIEAWLSEEFGSPDVWQIFERRANLPHRDNWKMRFRGVYRLVRRLKDEGNRRLLRVALHRWIDFAKTHLSLEPLRLQNGDRYEIRWRATDGVSSFEMSCGDKSLKFVCSVDEEEDREFLTALCSDYVDPVRCSRASFRFHGDVCEALLEAVKGKNYSVARKENDRDDDDNVWLISRKRISSQRRK